MKITRKFFEKFCKRLSSILNSLAEVCPQVDLKGDMPDQLFRGPLLGISVEGKPEETSLYFATWNGNLLPSLLPKPRFIEWDISSGRCLIAYQDSYAVFSALYVFFCNLTVYTILDQTFAWKFS